MGPNAVTPERVARVVELVRQFDGKIGHAELARMMKFSGGVMSLVIAEAVKQGKIKTTGFSRGRKAILSINRANEIPTRNWFEGWAGAPRLG